MKPGNLTAFCNSLTSKQLEQLFRLVSGVSNLYWESFRREA